jgi:hypothetical protein
MMQGTTHCGHRRQLQLRAQLQRRHRMWHLLVLGSSVPTSSMVGARMVAPGERSDSRVKRMHSPLDHKV